MKKLLIMITALMAVAVFATSSFAVNKVQMTLTSPTIYKAGCEKIGSTTYSFDGASVITAGDWWYMDLPENVTLCKSYNFVVVGMNDGAVNPNVYINTAVVDPYTKVGFNNADLSSMAAGSIGPLTTGGTTATYALTGGNMAFLVKGTTGSRRVSIYALTNSGQTPTMTAHADGTIQLKIFDGKAWSKTDTLAPNQTRILLDLDADGVYGEVNYLGGTSVLDEVIGGDNTTAVTAGEPYVENTLCSSNALMSGQYLYTSYASKSDKFTFSGDSQIAHTAASGAISLKACKGAESFDIALESGQSAAACWFAYDNIAVAANGDYCATGWAALGQRFLIEATAGFGDIDDKYSVTAQITSPTDGVYFSAAPAVTLIKSTEDECTVAGAASGALFTAYQGSTLATGYAPTTCTVNTGYRVDKVVQTDASVFKTDDGATSYDTIFVDFAAFSYGSTLVAAGEEVTVQLSLDRYPCGTIFTGSRTIGTFVTSCSSASTSTLRYPWLPGTAAAGWWGGFVITNFGTNSGVAVLTYRDSSGNTATYTTPAVAANALWVNSAVTAADLTNTIAASPYDPALNYSVSAACAFTAKGFAFTGNGTEGVGYSVDN